MNLRIGHNFLQLKLMVILNIDPLPSSQPSSVAFVFASKVTGHARGILLLGLEIDDLAFHKAKFDEHDRSIGHLLSGAKLCMAPFHQQERKLLFHSNVVR